MRPPMERKHVAILAAVMAVTVACAGSARGRPPAGGAPVPTAVVLISIDGFGAGYFDRLPTPNLHRIAAAGVRARWMLPAFPTQTFPNHYTIATGLLPANHGIVSNTFIDPADGARFRYSDTASALQPRWWLGEPVWVTAERQGRRAAAFFWPGTDVAIGGVLPSRWKHYQDDFPNLARVDSVLDWLSLPAAERPSLVTLYFSTVDHAGHDDGPDSPGLAAAVAEIDGALGRLLAGLERRGLSDRVNLVVVSDHGMAPISRERAMVLDDYLDRNSVNALGLGEFISIIPRDGDAGRVLGALAGAPHLRLYARDSVPARWRYRGSPRISPLVGVADEGWILTTRASLTSARRPLAGGHGFDNADSTMRALFVASGPAFRQGLVVEPFQNIHVYELLCRVLGLRPAPNDGSLDSVRVLLR